MRDVLCKSGMTPLWLAWLMALSLLLTACGFQPRWTPETVAPPASLEQALAEAAQARLDGGADLGGDAATTLSLTRDGAILTMLARNRSLAVQRFAPEISALGINEARAAFDPNLLATASYSRSVSPGIVPGSSVTSKNVAANASISEFAPTGTEISLSGNLSRGKTGLGDWQSAGSWSAGINQSLLRGVGPAVNLVTLRQARNSAARSEHELRGFVLDLVQQVENAYWDLVLANETLKIRAYSVQLAKEQLDLDQDMIEVERLAPDTIFSAQAALASREADLVDARAAVRSRTIDLIRLLDPDAARQWALRFKAEDTPVTAQVDLNPGVSAALSERYRPEIAQSRLDLANRDLEVVRTRNGLLPRLDAFANYGMYSSGKSVGDAGRHLTDGKYPDYQVGLSFEMSPLNRAERARDNRAKFQQQQAEAALRNLEQLVESDVRLAAVEVQRQWERIPATQQAVKSRQEELQAELIRFAVGKSIDLNVLQVQVNLIQAQLDEVTARIRYIQAITALYHAEGTLLERRGIGVEKR